MKVLFYIPSIDLKSGGTATYIQSVSLELGKLCELHIATVLSDTPAEIYNAKLHYVSDGLRNIFKFKKEWTRLLDKIRPNVVNINCCWMPQCALAQRIAQYYGYKVVLTPHGMLEPWILHRHYYTRKLPALLIYQKSAVKNADILHVTANCEASHISNLGWNKKIKIVGLGIDATSIDMKKVWKVKHKILFLSRIHVKKGIELLLDVISEIRENLADYQIVIAGEGNEDYVKSLRVKINETGLSHIVKLVGGVYCGQKWQLYQEADFFVLPTKSENFGLAIAESLASGTPVITTKGTPWEDLNTNNCGMWIDRNQEQLKNAILKMIHLDSSSLQVMGMNGRKLIEEKFSSKVMAKKMYSLYNELVQGE